MIRFHYTFLSPDAEPKAQWGSILHGILMESLPEPWPELLHQQEVHPFSQWIEVQEPKTFCWHIQALDDELGASIAQALAGCEKLYCRHMQTEFVLKKAEQESISPAEYMKPFFLSEAALRGLQLNLKTVCTHKVQGRYTLFPSVDLIAQSLRSRFCSIEPNFALADDEVLEQLIRYTRISRYRLQSVTYGLNQAYVTGYCGQLELHFDGPDALRRLAGVLFGLAEWCGIGIKTSLGMGGCVVSPLRDKASSNHQQRGEKNHVCQSEQPSL